MLGVVTIFHRVTDDRGRRWKPCEIKKASKASGIDRFLLAPPTRRPEMIRVAVVIGPIFAALFAITQSVIAWVRDGDPAIEIQLILMPFTAVLSGLLYGYMMSKWVWRSTRDARDAMLEYDLCPHCAHGIGGIPPEPDACTVCPECGAAWKVGLADEDQ